MITRKKRMAFAILFLGSCLTEYIYLYSNGLLLLDSNVNCALLALSFVNFDIEGNGSSLVKSLVSIRVDAGEMYEYVLMTR